MTDELASLEFLVDELLLEPTGARGQACAKQIYLHVYRGATLDAGQLARLLAGVSRMPPTSPSSSDAVLQRNVVWALAVHAYRRDDAAIVAALLAGPLALAVLQLDHRARVGPGVITTIVAYAEQADEGMRAHAFVALQRLGQQGASLVPAIDAALASLGTPARGRGHARIDLDALARGLLRMATREGADTAAQVCAGLERLASGTGKPAKSARELLDLLASG